MIEVRFQRGLHLPELDLWLDPWDAKPWAFVSHAHADHFARHQSAFCSEVTAGLLNRRYHLAENRIEPLAFQVPITCEGFRLRLLPAGHISGSAMLHVTRIRDNATLLYTGDFKTRRSRTAEPVNFLSADVLIMETTFGLPNFEFPNPMEVEASILRFIQDAFADGETPVLFGYPLGKAQEALALLAENGIPTLLFPTVMAMTVACRELGVDTLPEPVQFQGHAPPGHVIIAPPNAIRSKLLLGLKSKRTAMLTGWALQPGSKYRFRVDEVLPFSDHADHSGLMECIKRVRPKKILTVHGFAQEFAAELRAKGLDAWCAMGGDQLELSINQAAQKSGSANSPRHSRAICGLADFSDLCRLVGETSSRVAKTDFLSAYLGGLKDEGDLRLATLWLTGEILPDTAMGSTLKIGPDTIRRAIISLPNVKEERYREISIAQNDISRTARLVLQEIYLKPEPLELAGLAAFFQELATAFGSLDLIGRLTARLSTLHPAEGETLIKLLIGDLRIGLRECLVEDAIAAAFTAHPAEVCHAKMLTGDIGETAVLALRKKLGEASLRPMVPVKCMLAEPLERDADDCNISLVKLPFTPPVWLEPIYCGLRAQLHKLGDQVSIFSKNLQVIDGEFPELLAAACMMEGDFILDGIITGGAHLRNQPANKTGGGDLFVALTDQDGDEPLRFIAFDLFWCKDQDLAGVPLLERRSQLERLSLSPPIEVSDVYPANDQAELEAAFNQALKDGHHGLIAKDPNSFYLPGRRGNAWIKIKSEPSDALLG